MMMELSVHLLAGARARGRPSIKRALGCMAFAIAAALVVPTAGSANDRLAISLDLPVQAATVPATPGAPTLEPDGVYIPEDLDTSRPVPILVALHGYASSGPAIAARLRGCANAHGWVIVAPTMAYRNYFDPQQLRTDAEQNLPWLRALLDRIQSTARGFTPQPGILVYGFSRGAQMAHRFSMLYPDEVAAEATLSAGSYTLPQALDATGARSMFPFGINDAAKIASGPFDGAAFASIPTWVGVGGNDVNPDDTSRAWDALEGQTRVDRARVFAARLLAIGAPVELHVFPGASHEETLQMRDSACEFLAAHVEATTPDAS